MKISKEERIEKHNEFMEKIHVIHDALKQIGTNIDPSRYDGLLVKKLSGSDTTERKKGNTSHIALTADMMDMFPCFISQKYYHEADESLKNHFYCRVPLYLAASNIFYLYHEGNKIMTDRVDQFVNTFAAVSYRWYTNQNLKRQEQMQLSLTRKDGAVFVAFRKLVHENQYLILLKVREKFEYEAYGIIEDKGIEGDAGLKDLVNNYYHFYGLGRPYSDTPINPQKIDVGLYNELDFDFNSIKEKFGDFDIDDSLIKEILASINAGQNIILNGVPGTGKTHVAIKFAEEAMGENGYMLTTATSDWTTFDTIGGLMPNENGELEFHEGKVLQAIKQNKWLIIDEINRADIDKAFGQLFTSLSNYDVELPYKIDGKSVKIVVDDNLPFNVKKGSTYVIGRNWRIIGTMNSYDKNNLFDLSYAFMRRFRFVDVDIPKDFKKLLEKWKNGIFSNVIKNTETYHDKLTNLYKINSFDEGKENKYKINRQLGPAIFLDILKYIESRLNIEGNHVYNDKILSEAIIAYVIPQCEGLSKQNINNLIEFFKNDIFDNIEDTKVINKLEDLMPYY